MIVLPLGAAIVALVFAVLLARQFMTRRKPFQALWTLALLMYAGASLALFLGQIDGWTAAEFRAYWALGAVLNVPYLAAGESVLLFPRRTARNVVFLLLIAATVVAGAGVGGADVTAGALDSELPLGRHVFGDGSTPHLLAQAFGWGGYLILLAGTMWSALRIKGVAAQRDRFLGTLYIAAGATVVAIGTGVGASQESFPFFSVSLLVGMAVMFLGFLRASRRPAPAPD